VVILSQKKDKLTSKQHMKMVKEEGSFHLQGDNKKMLVDHRVLSHSVSTTIHSMIL
jgi:hypothetical protein